MSNSDDIADAIVALIDAKIDYAIASLEEDGDGQRVSAVGHRNIAERAEAELRAALRPKKGLTDY